MRIVGRGQEAERKEREGRRRGMKVMGGAGNVGRGWGDQANEGKEKGRY